MEFLSPDGGKILRKTWDLGLHTEQQLWGWNWNQSQEEAPALLTKFPPTPVTEAFTPFQGWGGVREGSTDKDHLLKGLRRAFVLESGLTVRGQKSRMCPVSSGDLIEPPLTSPSAPAWCGLQSQSL